MGDIWVDVVIGFIRIITFAYDVITYLPFSLIENPQKKLKAGLQIKAKPTDPTDEESPYRAVEAYDRLVSSPFPDCSTLDEFFSRAVQKFRSKDCLGSRELLSEEDEIQPNGKVFRKAVFGDYKWQTYDQLNERVNNFGRGLLKLGQKPKSNVCIFAETRADWIVAALACFRFGFPVVTLYSTLGDEAVAHGINECEVSFVVTSFELLPKFKSILSSLPKLQHIIYMQQHQTKKRPVEDFPASVSIHAMTSIEALGARELDAAAAAAALDNPRSDDTAVIMYTSGSTGIPKGVVISHANILSAVTGLSSRVTQLGVCDDVYIGYLPLAHILELDAELICVGFGIPIGFSSPNTLTDKSTRIKRGSKGDASILRPTLMAAVPVILDRVSKGVWDKVNEASPLQSALFKYLYEYKSKHYEAGFGTPLLDRLVFAKTKSLLGGRLRLVLSGGAPLSPDSQRFINICFCCPVAQGYGLTETTGAATICQGAIDRSTGRVGAPLCCSEIRLVDWIEGGYKTSDRPNPRGEVWIAGTNVAVGYYKNPDQTVVDFHVVNGKRWFASGDIGEFHKDGCLEIIDRKKDLVKLENGEYIALGRIEAAIKLCPSVDNACVCVCGQKSYVVCLVLPNQHHLKSHASALGIAFASWQELCVHSEIKTQILKEIETHCAKAKLSKVEIPKKLKLCAELWTSDNGLVTESFKLKRKSIEKFYATDIEIMFK